MVHVLVERESFIFNGIRIRFGNNEPVLLCVDADYRFSGVEELKLVVLKVMLPAVKKDLRHAFRGDDCCAGRRLDPDEFLKPAVITFRTGGQDLRIKGPAGDDFAEEAVFPVFQRLPEKKTIGILFYPLQPEGLRATEGTGFGCIYFPDFLRLVLNVLPDFFIPVLGIIPQPKADRETRLQTITVCDWGSVPI